MTVTSWAAEYDGDEFTEAEAAADAVTGALVHRMLQTRRDGDAALEDLARSLLTAEERAAIDDLDGVLARAAAACAALLRRPELASLLDGGTLLREVPFSMNAYVPPRENRDLTPSCTARPIVRGTIDLLVVRDDGSVVVVEFKTGRRRPTHERQLEIYVQAARALFPGRRVDGCLVYP